MSAEIIQLQVKRNEGNGAREALIDMGLIPTTAEWILMDLWSRGFKVVRLKSDGE